MGKFQLNKKGEDPIKIYEDTFKIAQGTVESHLDKLGKMPNPISRENIPMEGNFIDGNTKQGKDRQGDADFGSGNRDQGYTTDLDFKDSDGKYASHTKKDRTSRNSIGERLAREVNGKYVLNGMVIGKVTDFEPNNWFGKVELSAMPEFAEFGTLDPLAVVEGDDGVTYKDPKGGSDGSRGTLLEPDGNPMVNVTSYDEDHKEDFLRDLYGEVESIANNKSKKNNNLKSREGKSNDLFKKLMDVPYPNEFETINNKDLDEKENMDNSYATWGEVSAIAKEAISEDEKDEMFQYLFDLQESGITNMFGAGPYVEREFPHLDKKEVRDVVLEWMKNYEEIHARMGIESKASEQNYNYCYRCKGKGYDKNGDTCIICDGEGITSSQESKAKEYDDEYEYDDDGTKLNPLYDDDDEYIDGSDVPTSGTYESKAREFYNDTGDAGRFLETPQLQQIRNHWDNVMPEEEKRSMLEGMAFLYKSSPFQKFDGLNWEVKESVALSVAGLVGLSIDMGTLYGQQHLDDLRNMPWD